ncbi:MAG: hypothetical protein QXS37_05390 [Candidatus Aenigmatarchaeota archaeon]
MRRRSYLIRVSEEFKNFLDRERKKIAEIKNVDIRMVTYPYLTSKIAEKLTAERNQIVRGIQTLKKTIKGLKENRELIMLESVLIMFNFVIYLINFVI